MAKLSAGGGITGAISGGSAGSAFGPIGTGIGAVVGGITGLFGGKKKKKKKQISTLDPQQRELYNQQIAGLSGQGQFADLYNFDANQANQVFDQNVSRPAYRNFEENVIPKITGQFRGQNLQNSSYLGQDLSRAGRNVQEGLDAQRASLQFQGQENARSNRQNALDKIMNMQTFAYQKPGAQTPSVIDQVLNSVGPSAGEWFADYLRGSGKQGSALAPKGALQAAR